jgi:pyruvate dehydrogenase E2 component (dihydrolipoamide acetyltransferase)
MAEVINMPKLGFDMKEGTLVRWVKQEGEKVTKGDVLAEIETDKATVEVESTFSGILFSQLVETDAIVPIGEPIAVIADEGEKVDLDSLVGKQSEAKPDTEDVKEEKSEQVSVDQSQSDEVEQGDRIKASPLAKKMAAEHDLKLSEIQGSGPGGRIVKKDIEGALASESSASSIEEKEPQVQPKTSKDAPKETGSALPAPVWGSGQVESKENRVPMNKLRQAISRRMVDSKQNIPHFYVTKDIYADALMSLYKQVNETVPSDQKISINDFVIKATALTLREYPNLNASISNGELIQHGNINIGVAVAVEGGLLTIVVRNADLKPIRVISTEVKEMASRVRSGKVRSEDVEGSTFSISNLGMFDVENFAAIINPPESAILAVSSARKEAIVVGDEIKIGWRMKSTISADHRTTDGVEAAQFMKTLSYQLENPLRLLL